MDSWKLLSPEKVLEVLAPFIQAGLPTADITSLAKIFTEEETPELPWDPSGESLPQNPSVEPLSQLQPTATPTAPPSHSSPFVATASDVAHPVQEKSHASKTMIGLVQTVTGSRKSFLVELIHMIDTGGQPEFMEIMPSFDPQFQPRTACTES